MNFKKKIAIVGGGVAAMMLASELNNELFDINIFEKGSSIGKKFLVAGKGGFNLTHSEPLETFVTRYEPSSFLRTYLERFSNQDLRNWLGDIGISTIVGSSKKVYPIKGIRPNQVLEAIKNKLSKNRVKIHYKHELIDILSESSLLFITKNSTKTIMSDIVVFAMGGASWKVTGSDGKWLQILNKAGVKTKDFEPSNCAFRVNWDNDFLLRNEGKPLKNIATRINEKYIKGELMITKFGLEGGAIYAMSSKLRKELKKNNTSSLYIDLKPTNSIEMIEKNIKRLSSRLSITKILKEYIKLDKTKIDLIKKYISKEEFKNTKTLSDKIKNMRIDVTGIADIDEAISTVGGISLDAVDKNLKIKSLPFHYAIGEMLDWDAPTGGYLLQASFSMGYYLAKHLNDLNDLNIA